MQLCPVGNDIVEIESHKYPKLVFRLRDHVYINIYIYVHKYIHAYTYSYMGQSPSSRAVTPKRGIDRISGVIPIL